MPLPADQASRARPGGDIKTERKGAEGTGHCCPLTEGDGPRLPSCSPPYLSFCNETKRLQNSFRLACFDCLVPSAYWPTPESTTLQLLDTPKPWPVAAPTMGDVGHIMYNRLTRLRT